MHYWSILTIVQWDATQISLFIVLRVHSTCFGCQPHLSSGAQKNCNYSLGYWSYFVCSYLPSKWPSLATLEGGIWPVPEAVVTVLCAPDDGCGWHPKYVEWICRTINRLLSVASGWTIIIIFSFFFASNFSVMLIQITVLITLTSSWYNLSHI